MEIPKIKLEKHTSPDNPQGNYEYYVVTVEGFAHNLYSSLYPDKAMDRFIHIQEIGYAAYLEEIKITKTVITEEEFNYPELIEALKRQEAAGENVTELN